MFISLTTLQVKQDPQSWAENENGGFVDLEGTLVTALHKARSRHPYYY
jgi:hypothetical protein